MACFVIGFSRKAFEYAKNEKSFNTSDLDLFLANLDALEGQKHLLLGE